MSLKCLGVYSGIGAPLLGARAAGFEIVGNIDHRKIFKKDQTFVKNFNAPMWMHHNDAPLDEFKNIDLVFGHPACGGFSTMRVNKEEDKDYMIPDFVDAVKRIQPKFFAMDNLAKSLTRMDAYMWIEAFPEYDLFFEWVSNYGYGNAQINRDRLFVIGALKDLDYAFVPNEEFKQITVWDKIKDLPQDRDIPEIQHIHYRGDYMTAFRWYHFNKGWPGNEFVPIEDLKGYIRDWPNFKNFTYFNRKGEVKPKIGYYKVDIHKPARTLTGGGGVIHNQYRTDTLEPFTIRERCRLMGFPDDFLIYPLKYWNVGGTVENHHYKRTGKAIPTEFPEYFAKQVRDFLMGTWRPEEGVVNPVTMKPRRIIKENEYIQEAKRIYDAEVGYNDLQSFFTDLHGSYGI